jgi:hypothetical protein
LEKEKASEIKDFRGQKGRPQRDSTFYEPGTTIRYRWRQRRQIRMVGAALGGVIARAGSFQSEPPREKIDTMSKKVGVANGARKSENGLKPGKWRACFWESPGEPQAQRAVAALSETGRRRRAPEEDVPQDKRAGDDDLETPSCRTKAASYEGSRCHFHPTLQIRPLLGMDAAAIDVVIRLRGHDGRRRVTTVTGTSCPGGYTSKRPRTDATSSGRIECRS